ncbi:MAG: YbhB/YbcL family Raf kinase inhibitor-like protein [Sphingomonadaceae bacterium]|nr:YbhB/YbcL family Raf kinase inhibitor-like protein [Sphingomonadaceae bacterium]
MSDPVPAWLAGALNASGPAAGKLAIARLGSERALGRGGFALKSAAFRDGDELDPCFTADEEDAVAPPLEWTAPPPGTQELVLVVEDASSPGDEPLCHWLVWGFPGQKGQLLEGEVPPRVGKNSLKNSEWMLPAPPEDDDAHTYVFQLFALELPLTLMPGAGRKDVLAALENNVTACAVLTATYARQEEEDWDDEDDLD